jgi:hypothetical protein
LHQIGHLPRAPGQRFAQTFAQRMGQVRVNEQSEDDKQDGQPTRIPNYESKLQ